MKTQFDKIYVISLITNKERQEFIKYQFNEIGLDFEFIYSIDYSLFNKDINNDNIKWPFTIKWGVSGKFNNARNFGCTITHYTAINKAYEFGYNNVLVIEDDICFIKDINLISYYLNNIPNDADFINFDLRFCGFDNKILSFFDEIKENNKNYLVLPNDISNIGGMMYGIMNRNSMELYLKNQRENLCISDGVKGFWNSSSIKRYIPKYCICTDIFNILNNFETDDNDLGKCYNNIYNYIYKNLNNNMFYNPSNNSKKIIFTRF